MKGFGMKTIFTVMAMAGLVACGGKSPEKKAAADGPVVRVQTVEVSQETWPLLYEAAGTVRARTSATLSSRVMGYVREIRVQPGDRVNAGQLVATLESRELESAVKQAQAAEVEARSAVAEAEQAIAAARAQTMLAKSTFDRMDTLHKKKSISEQEFDEAQARLRTAEATLEMAQAKRKQLDARIAQARQGVEAAETMLGFTKIHAPFAGLVTEKPGAPGQLATPGMPLVVVEQGGIYRLEAAVEESMLGSVRVGQKVSVRLDVSAETLEARVDEIVPSVDPQSRAFTVKVGLPASANARSGSFGRLLVERGKDEVVVLPAGALVQRGELQQVYVVDAGVARTRMVTVGRRIGEKAAVLSGLVAGDRVVFPLSAGLVDGVKVEVR